MSEHFLRLDPSNYNTELEYLLYNDVFKFEDYKEFYENKRMSEKDWEIVKDWFNERL